MLMPPSCGQRSVLPTGPTTATITHFAEDSGHNFARRTHPERKVQFIDLPVERIELREPGNHNLVARIQCGSSAGVAAN
jgi:hypothetical protein